MCGSGVLLFEPSSVLRCRVFPQAPHIDDFTNALTAGLDVIRQVMSQIGAWDDIQTLFEATAELRAAKDRVRCSAVHVPCWLALDVCMLVQVGDNNAVTVLALGIGANVVVVIHCGS